MNFNILTNIKFYKKIKLISHEYNLNTQKKSKLSKKLHKKFSRYIKILKILGCLPYKKQYIINNNISL